MVSAKLHRPMEESEPSRTVLPIRKRLRCDDVHAPLGRCVRKRAKMTTQQVYSWFGEDTKDKLLTGEDFTYKQPYWAQPELGGLFSSRWKRYTAINEWCCKTFGESNDAWKNPRWSASDRKYWFKYEKDRMLFVLRWS